MQYQNRRWLVLIGLIVIVTILLGIIGVRGPSKPSGTVSGQHVDPFSHETVSNPPGKGPDKFSTPAGTPVYLGFDKLLNYGLGFGQLRNVQTAFYRFSKAQSKPIGQISVDVDHIISSHNSADPNSLFQISFKVQFDGAKIDNAKIQYSGLNDVRLDLIDSKTGKIVYDSGVLYSSLPSD